MKITLFTFLLIAVTMMSACENARERTAKDLLASPKMEEEIYTAILNDDAHLSKLLDKMVADENCKRMMERNKTMVKLICMSDNVDTLMIADQQVMENMTNKMIRRMEADSVVCDKTCTQIMESDPLKKYFGKYAQPLPIKYKGK